MPLDKRATSVLEQGIGVQSAQEGQAERTPDDSASAAKRQRLDNAHNTLFSS